MNTQEHRVLREQLGDYALGHHTADLRAHLDKCDSCQDELAELTPLVAALAAVNPDRLDTLPTPPTSLRERIARSVEAEQHSRVRSGTIRRGAAALAVAATLAGVFGLGTLVGRESTPTPPVEAIVVDTVASDVQIDADLVAHTWGTEIRMVASGLQGGAIYSVTFLRSDGETVPAGTFIGTGGSALRCSLNAALLREDAVGVIVSDPAGTTVMHADLD